MTLDEFCGKRVMLVIKPNGITGCFFGLLSKLHNDDYVVQDTGFRVIFNKRTLDHINHTSQEAIVFIGDEQCPEDDSSPSFWEELG